MKSNIRIKLLSILYTLALINSTIIKEGYHFFDVFYYRDMYKNYLKQKRNNKCSLDEGPNCLYIKSKNESEIQIELKNIYPEDNNIDKESLESIYLKLKNTTKLYTDKETSTIEDEVFQFDSPYVMTLLLSFESYDEKTNLGDIYAPETIDTPFDLGRVTLTIVGKLRLTQKNSNNFDSKEVIMKFNLKSTISSLYIKKNKYNENNKTFYLYGYKNGNKHVITKIQNVPSTQWIRVNGDGKKYESIGLIRGFDYDNISIMSSMEGLPNYNQLTKQFSSFINEKIRTTINEEVNKIKSGKGIDSKEENGVKIIKINLDQADIDVNDKEEDIDFPEEYMKEIESIYKNENEQIKNLKKEEGNNNNDKDDKNRIEDL